MSNELIEALTNGGLVRIKKILNEELRLSLRIKDIKDVKNAIKKLLLSYDINQIEFEYCKIWVPVRFNLDIIDELIDYEICGDFMKSFKWSKSDHNKMRCKQTRNNMQMVFMMYRYEMLEKL